jgi:hypothetical protein
MEVLMLGKEHGDAMRKESRQQRVVDDIMWSLNQATEGSGEAYVDIFRQLGINALLALGHTLCARWVPEHEAERWKLITVPIEEFTQDERERKLLLSIVMRKLAGIVTDRHRYWYRQESQPLSRRTW